MIFGFALVLSEPGDNFTMSTTITAEILQEKEVLIFGTPDEVGEKLLKIKDAAYGDDFNIAVWFELGDFRLEDGPECVDLIEVPSVDEALDRIERLAQA